MKHLFIDTNVLLDLLIDRKPFSDNAAIFFEKSAKNDVRLYASSLSFTNIYCIIRQHSTRDKAIEVLSDLKELVEILAVDDKIIKKSIAAGFNDFEDAIQHFCAAANPFIEAIVTRNEKDFKKSDLPVFNPEAVLAMLE